MVPHVRLRWIICLLSIFLCHTGIADTPLQQQREAYLELYHDDAEDGRYDCLGGCTRNVITFVLEDLIPKGIEFKDAYIVSMRGANNEIHFLQDAFTERAHWPDRSSYSHHRYSHHTFLVIDGRVFDFSIHNGSIHRAKKYLERGFLPPSRVEERVNLFHSISKKSQIASLSSKDGLLKIVRLDAISKTQEGKERPSFKYSLGEASFVGLPIDFFLLHGALRYRDLPDAYREKAKARVAELRRIMKSGEFEKRNYRLCHSAFLQSH